MKEPKSQVIEMPNDNLDAPKVSQDKDFYQKEGEYPVEIKTQEQSHSDEGEEVSDAQIQMAVRAGFIRKVYGILSIQLLITFGAVFFCLNIQKSSFIRKFSSFFFFIILSSFPLLGLLSRIVPKSSL